MATNPGGGDLRAEVLAGGGRSGDVATPGGLGRVDFEDIQIEELGGHWVSLVFPLTI